jgi:hypothetical protein
VNHRLNTEEADRPLHYLAQLFPGAGAAFNWPRESAPCALPSRSSVETLRILDSRKAISSERAAALDFAVQIKRADALLEEFDHLLFDALVEVVWRSELLCACSFGLRHSPYDAPFIAPNCSRARRTADVMLAL